MSKIICEVCGTSYQETAEQCPICGCVRSGEPEIVADKSPESAEPAVAQYTYVKGGRFSKANVKKRNKASLAPIQMPVQQELNDDNERDKDPEEQKSAIDKWLTVAIIVLLLSVIAVVVYLALPFFNIQLPVFQNAATTDPAVSTTEQQPSTPPATDTAPATTAPTQPENVSCQALKINNDVIRLDKVGAVILLNIEVLPAECTDPITYSSADETVATVTESGKIVAVGSGTTVITATCGGIKLDCTVYVDAAEPTTEPTTQPTTEPTTAPTTKPVEFALNRSDFTLASKGESWVLYNGSIPKNQINWSSDNEAVATVSGGKVVAVGPGVTTVRAEYNGIKVSCIVRCSFAAETTEPTSAPTTAPTEPSAPSGGTDEATAYSISHQDVTLVVGERFALTLKDSSGNTISVSWYVSDSSVCSVSGNTITGLSAGTAKVYVPYGGREYSCIVRVRTMG